MIETESHFDMILILPCISITAGECTDPACTADHWRLSFGWLAWSIHLIF